MKKIKKYFGSLHSAITIDPGKNTGLAFWLNGRVDHTKLIKCNFNTKDEPIKSIEHILNGLSEEIENFYFGDLISLYVEGVQMWSDSLKSVTSTVRGDTFILAYIVGAIGSLKFSMPDRINEIKILKPVQWKGQLSKDQVHRRIRLVLNNDYPEHIADAVGMGLSIQGML